MYKPHIVIKKKNSSVFIGAILILALSGCTVKFSAPYREPAAIPGGVYHKVRKGETLWRIARTYGVDLEELVRANRLPDASRIGTGQLIFVPGAKEIRQAPPAEKTASEEANFIWPLKGKIISFFGSKSGDFTNKGISIRAEEGEKICAVRDGRVAFVDDGLGGWGKIVIIEHTGGFLTVYAHNSRILVESGQEVRRGEPIALAGSSGRTPVPQLYFEIRRRDIPQNPLYFLPH